MSTLPPTPPALPESGEEQTWRSPLEDFAGCMVDSFRNAIGLDALDAARDPDPTPAAADPAEIDAASQTAGFGVATPDYQAPWTGFLDDGPDAFTTPTGAADAPAFNPGLDLG